MLHLRLSVSDIVCFVHLYTNVFRVRLVRRLYGTPGRVRTKKFSPMFGILPGKYLISGTGFHFEKVAVRDRNTAAN